MRLQTDAIPAVGHPNFQIEDGKMDFTVYQSAVGQGESAVYAAIALATGKDVTTLEGATADGLYVWVPFEKVDSSNVKNYE